MAALKETQSSDEGQLEEVSAGCTFSGATTRGVAFGIQNDIVEQLPGLLHCIKDGLISPRLPLREGKFATIVSVYAPPMISPDTARNEFYEELNDAAISDLLAEKNLLYKAYVDRATVDSNSAFYRSRRLVQQKLREMQDVGRLARPGDPRCGFYPPGGTADMIFAARQLQEKCQKMRAHPYSTFVDLMKVFKTLNCKRLWKIMQKIGCPERLTRMVRQLHDGMVARVTDNGAASETFAVTDGMKEGCVFVPILFDLMFSAVVMEAYHAERPGTRVVYRTDGQLVNHWRMRFRSRASTTTPPHEFHFADDCALNATSEGDVQRIMDVFATAAGDICHTGHLYSPHTSAWSITCKFIAQGLAN
nr:unnamed protein product [Spirometra erinaceieuropaei]